MKVIGEKLKASREEKSLSLEEVSEDIKISVKDLENIEAGNKKAFTDVFELKQNIRDYAKYLGLDYENLVEEFNEYMFEYTSKIPVAAIERISKQKEKEEEEKGAPSPYTIIKRKKVNKKLIIIVSVILLIIISAVAVFTIKEKNKRSNELALSSLI